MNKESKREILIEALKNIPPEMRRELEILQEEGKSEQTRPDFIWHFLLQSFATMGSSRGWHGLIGDRANYERVTFEALSNLKRSDRPKLLDEVMRSAKVRMPGKKAVWLDLNYDLVVGIGGLQEAKRQAFAEHGTEPKIAFMKQFHGIGDKYARNIWMDVYHPDFHNSIAIDERVKRITEALGYYFKTYDQHERFYQNVAREADLQGWELDRLLYNYRDYFLHKLA